MYEERPSSVPGAVAWVHRSVSGEVVQVLPDGCMDLIWLDEHLVVAGPDRRSQPSEAIPGGAVHGVRFAPGHLPGLLGVPAHAVVDQRVPLDALWTPAAVRPLEDRVAGADDPTAALEAIARDHLPCVAPLAAEIPVIARSLDGGEPVASIADRIGLSTRQLHRRSLDAFGYGPKVLARILRLQRALALARAGRPAADAAIGAGYADQAHLARDCRALTGTTFSRLVA